MEIILAPFSIEKDKTDRVTAAKAIMAALPVSLRGT